MKGGEKMPGLMLAIMGKSKKPGPSEADKPAPEMPEEEDMGLAGAADEVFDALKADDREAFRAALQAFCEMCG